MDIVTYNILTYIVNPRFWMVMQSHLFILMLNILCFPVFVIAFFHG